MAIKHKRKTGVGDTGYTWLVSDLDVGQIGLNTFDGTIHILTTGSPQEVVAFSNDSLAGASIDHQDLIGAGTNDHSTIDSHISDSTIHFTQASISITESQISDLGDYALLNGSNQPFTGDLTIDSTSSFAVLALDGSSGGRLDFNDDGVYKARIEGSSTGITFEAPGTILRLWSAGVLQVYASNYETLVTNDDHIPNKKYVDDAILALETAIGSPVTGGGGGASALDDLTDVITDSGSPLPAVDDVLAYNGSNWVPTQVLPGALTSLTDTYAGSPTAAVDDVLTWSGSQWQPAPVSGGGGISNVVEDTTPQLGNNLDLNQFSVELDPTPTSDDTGNGLIITATVDVNTNGVGNAMHVDTDGNWVDADADATTSMPCTGIALETGTGSKEILLYGIIRNDGWSWTVGGPIYVSTTAGAFTQTAPSGTGDQVQTVGVALSTDVLYFNPDFTLVEVA